MQFSDGDRSEHNPDQSFDIGGPKSAISIDLFGDPKKMPIFDRSRFSTKNGQF